MEFYIFYSIQCETSVLIWFGGIVSNVWLAYVISLITVPGLTVRHMRIIASPTIDRFLNPLITLDNLWDFGILRIFLSEPAAHSYYIIDVQYTNNICCYMYMCNK